MCSSKNKRQFSTQHKTNLLQDLVSDPAVHKCQHKQHQNGLTSPTRHPHPRLPSNPKQWQDQGHTKPFTPRTKPAAATEWADNHISAHKELPTEETVTKTAEPLGQIKSKAKSESKSHRKGRKGWNKGEEGVQVQPQSCSSGGWASHSPVSTTDNGHDR